MREELLVGQHAAGKDCAMGAVDDARAATAAFRQQASRGITQLEGIRQGVGAAQQNFRGQLGNTTHPRVAEAEARCRESQQKVADAIQALRAASEAAHQLTAGL
ncbi:MAG: hypothetical protein HKP61_16940 [Dactylosporangium sp.]|nr:hypothetical protein [Dactylosporangium sp.]NNJ62594.1 hypothetical protein [Dactylosporangium sp.]